MSFGLEILALLFPVATREKPQLKGFCPNKVRWRELDAVARYCVRGAQSGQIAVNGRGNASNDVGGIKLLVTAWRSTAEG